MTMTTDTETCCTPLAVATDHTAFVGALKSLLALVPTKPTLPILAGVVVTGQGDHLTLQYRNWDLELSVTVEGSGTGQAVLPGLLLLARITDAKKCAITMTTFDGVVHVGADGATYRLVAMPMEDYPPAQADPRELVGLLTRSEFAELTSVVEFASTDPTLPGMNRVEVVYSQGVLTGSATDRYRLGECRVDSPWVEPATAGRFAIPREVARWAHGTFADDAHIHLSDTRVSLQSGRWTVEFTNPTEEFPAVNQLLKAVPEVVTMETSAAAKAVKQMRRVLTRNAPVRLSRIPGTVQFEAVTKGFVDACTEVPAECEHLGSASYNPAFLASVLDVLDGRLVSWGFEHPTKPAIFTDPARPYLRVLLMPVRTP